MTSDDEKFMRRAIALSEKTSLIDSAGGVFGTVIVLDGEIEAIRNACRKVGSFKLTGATLYTSAEPCPMCMAASYWAGIDRVFYASTNEDALEYGDFDDSMIYGELKKPVHDRSIRCEQIMQDEAVEVWKKYKNKAGRVPY